MMRKNEYFKLKRRQGIINKRRSIILNIEHNKKTGKVNNNGFLRRKLDRIDEYLMSKEKLQVY